MIKTAISKLYRGENLDSGEMRESMSEIMEGRAEPAQIGAFLVLLGRKGETVEEITQAAKVMRSKSVRIISPGEVVDTCSTGGSGAKRFNISTTTAFVLAGMGLKVAKHGNRAVSSSCGSADVLSGLGADIDLPAEKVEKCLRDTGICFMFAPVFHRAMKHAMGPRKQLGVRTVFNILGPLTSPAAAEYQLLGVFDPSLVDTLALVLNNLGVKRAMVVHGEGLDEITLSGTTVAAEVSGGKVRKRELNPGDFGLPSYSADEIEGGDIKANSRIMKSVLEGSGGACRDIVLANASGGFFVTGKAANLREGVEMARESIDSGRALGKLKEFIETTKRVKK